MSKFAKYACVGIRLVGCMEMEKESQAWYEKIDFRMTSTMSVCSLKLIFICLPPMP